MIRWLFAGLLLALLAQPASVAAASPGPRCFAGVAGIANCIDERFAAFWEANGGLTVFGYPLTAAAAGGPPVAQTFERERLELHPQNRPPYDVLLGRLGVDRLAQLGRDPQHLPRAGGPRPGCLWFAATGHNVCDQAAGSGFLTYWQSHGLADPALDAYQRSVALFGLPLTESAPEPGAEGGTLVTQWFERARFEYHPGNPAAFRVQLGRLGAELRTPVPQPAPKTGIRGQVTIGPNCPGPDTGDPACESKPYPATIALLAADRTFVQTIQADSQGLFAVALAPGTYILVPQSPGRYPHASEQTVTVTADRLTPVTIDYDTGIR